MVNVYDVRDATVEITYVAPNLIVDGSTNGTARVAAVKPEAVRKTREGATLRRAIGARASGENLLPSRHRSRRRTAATTRPRPPGC